MTPLPGLFILSLRSTPLWSARSTVFNSAPNARRSARKPASQLMASGGILSLRSTMLDSVPLALNFNAPDARRSERASQALVIAQ